MASEIESGESPEVAPEDLRERIRNRAYDLFLERARSGVPGDEYSDWLNAEAEVQAELEAARR